MFLQQKTHPRVVIAVGGPANHGGSRRQVIFIAVKDIKIYIKKKLFPTNILIIPKQKRGSKRLSLKLREMQPIF
jgi:hypothetical protein